MKSYINYFSKTELTLWFGSIVLLLASFFLLDRENYMTLIASMIGITSLIFNAKGNPIGQILMLIFSVFYGIISYSFSYYGEMITYLGMTAPMAVFALVSWIRNPYKGNKAEVEVSDLRDGESLVILLLSLVVTVVFYFILKYFNTANLLPSTISVTTSFVAAYLTLRRNPYFAVVYAVNDVVLIVLWILASIADTSYLSVVICFVLFLVNDLYGFLNWNRMKKRQMNDIK